MYILTDLNIFCILNDVSNEVSRCVISESLFYSIKNIELYTLLQNNDYLVAILNPKLKT